MTKRRFIPLVFAVSLALSVAALSPTAFATDDPHETQAPEQAPEPPAHPAEEASITSFISEGVALEELPADVQDAIAAHDHGDGQAKEYALDDLKQALAAMPADCAVELGAEVGEALAGCGITLDPMPMREDSAADPSEEATAPTPDMSETGEPSAPTEDVTEPDDAEPSDSEWSHGPAGGGMPVGGFSPVRVRNAVGLTCDGTKDAAEAISRSQTCAHRTKGLLDWKWQEGSLRLVGWANLEFYLLATTDPKSYRITFDNKVRATIKGGTYGENMPIMAPVTGLRDPETSDWIGIPTTFPHVQISASSWHDFQTVVHESPGMPGRAIRYYDPAFLFELREFEAPIVINETSSFAGTTIRCDNNAVNKTGHGCVTDFEPTLTYSKSGVESGVAKHIEKAQVLGAPATLHREYPPRNNRTQSCPSWLKRDRGYECDEYPFHTAVEGGTSLGNTRNAHPIVVPVGCRWRPVGPPDNSLSTPTSRCQVKREQNRAGGNQLIAFYRANRIINNDAFAVKIVP